MKQGITFLALVCTLAVVAGCGDRGANSSNSGDGQGVPQGPTGLRGYVLETITSNPLTGVTVSVGNDEMGWTKTKTDATGLFELLDIDVNSNLMRLDGATVLVADGQRYPTVTVQLHQDWINLGQITMIPDDKFLPDISRSPSVDMSEKMVPSADVDHPASDGWMQITQDVMILGKDMEVPFALDINDQPLTTTVYASIAAGTFIKFPEGVDPVISVTQVPVDQLPHRLPTYVAPEAMVTFQPGGTLLDPPAPLHFGDLRNYDEVTEDMEYNVWSLSHSQSMFLDLGKGVAQEGEFGKEIGTKGDVGLKELGWHTFVCGNVNFEVDVSQYYDDETITPEDGTVSLSVWRGGWWNRPFRKVTNQGGKIKTGNINMCGGFFRVRFKPNATLNTPGRSFWLPGWRCIRRLGRNRIGNFRFDVPNSRIVPLQIMDRC